MDRSQKQNSNRKDPCLKYACRLQTCLDRKGYDDQKCLNEIQDIRECCEYSWRDSTVCEGFLNDLKSYRDFIASSQTWWHRLTILVHRQLFQRTYFSFILANLLIKNLCLIDHKNVSQALFVGWSLSPRDFVVSIRRLFHDEKAMKWCWLQSVLVKVIWLRNCPPDSAMSLRCERLDWLVYKGLRCFLCCSFRLC